MIVGIVAAKKESSRFPGKNKFVFRDKPLFWHSVETLLKSHLVNKVYVATDDEEIRSYCENKNVPVIWRNKNASDTNDKLLNILKFAFYSIKEEPSAIITIMANCPNHTVKDVNKAINIMKEHSLREVRSFDRSGLENGLLLLSRDAIKHLVEMSCYIGGIITDGKEIHYKEELLKLT